MNTPVYNSAAVLQAALEHHRAGRLAQAKVLYQQILQTEPDHPDALHYLGAIASNEGRHQQAVELIGRAASIRPSRSMHYNLGNAFKALGRLEEAEQRLLTAKQLAPENVDVYVYLAQLYRRKMKRITAADEHVVPVN